MRIHYFMCDDTSNNGIETFLKCLCSWLLEMAFASIVAKYPTLANVCI